MCDAGALRLYSKWMKRRNSCHCIFSRQTGRAQLQVKCSAHVFNFTFVDVVDVRILLFSFVLGWQKHLHIRTTCAQVFRSRKRKTKSVHTSLRFRWVPKLTQSIAIDEIVGRFWVPVANMFLSAVCQRFDIDHNLVSVNDFTAQNKKKKFSNSFVRLSYWLWLVLS